MRLIGLLVVLLGAQRAQGVPILQETDPSVKTADKKDDEISTVITAANKNAFFEATAKYTYEVKNPTNNNQFGKVSYTVLDQDGKQIGRDSIKVSVAKKSTGEFNFNIPGKGAGFYKVNFRINVTDYDDTTQVVFGVKPELLTSNHERPEDFDTFWQNTKKELARVDPQFKVTLMPKLSTKKCNVYLVEMHSLGNVIVHAWLTEPVTKNPKKKFAVILGLPGYQIELPPIINNEDNDVAFITLNVRGQGNSRTNINIRHDEYVVHNIEDKNKYVMRGVIMDCLRTMDFIYSRSEFDHEKIFVKGGSMGGFLAIATASLDKRVNLCSAQSPIFADMRTLIHRVNFPITSFNMYLKTQPGLTLDKILDNMDYFDAKNFAPNISCKFLMSIGLLDTYVPPTNDFVVYNSMKTDKRIRVYKELGHEVSPLYIKLEGSWMHDEFGLFF